MPTLSLDAWMNISGVCGVAIYLGSHWWRIRVVRVEGFINRFLRGFGLFLLLIPLFFRWYLSSGMTLLLSIILLVAAGVMVLHHRTSH